MAYRHPRPARPCARCGKSEWRYDRKLMQEWRCTTCGAYPRPARACSRCGHGVWVYDTKTHHWFCERLALHAEPRAATSIGKENLMNTRTAAYVVDTAPGKYAYTEVEGVGRCRPQFARLVTNMDAGNLEVVMVADVALFFVETSPMWMEKFIATVKRNGVRIVDTTAHREYDLREAEDLDAFRAQGE